MYNLGMKNKLNRRVDMMMTDNLYAHLLKLAEERDISMSRLIRNTLEEEVARDHKRKLDI